MIMRFIRAIVRAVYFGLGGKKPRLIDADTGKDITAEVEWLANAQKTNDFSKPRKWLGEK